MAGNPRKFSEKIALHTQKQAEETAAFEQIMKEVMDVSRTTGGGPGQGQPQTQNKQQNLLNIKHGSMNCRSLPNVHQMSQHGDKGQHGGHFGQKASSPRASRNSIGPVKTPRSRTDHSPYASPPSLSMLSSSMTGNSGSNIHSPMMYPTNYLSPPMDAPWRRANSDSAINSLIIPSVVPDSSEESSNNSNDPRDTYALGGMGHSPKHHHHHDPQSVIPNTVGDGPNLLEIPSSVSTGSLPDLTNFQFTPPLQQPIDTEDSQLTNSPYSTSPLSLTYSPTGGSPNPQPHSNNPQVSQHSQHQQQHHNQHQSQSHQQQQQQQQQSQQQQQQQQHQNMMDNPLNVNVNTFQNFTQNDNMLTAYRCPPRPSPQNSPSPFRSPSPLDGQLSAPSSPSAPPQLQNSESYYLSQQANALQQHFEQISMMDGSPNPPQRNSWQGGGMVNNSPYFYNTGQGQIQTGATAGITQQQSPQHHQPQTPQTPSSIPDIIFTDFSDVRSSEPLDDLLVAQALREGLGSLDMEGFNMLADPDLVPLDPQAEDSFRQDRQ